MKILIAEDEKTSQLLLNHVLAPVGSVDIVSDGLEAVEKVAELHRRNNSYDLICLDILMPKQDGFETLEQIRALEKQSGLTARERSRIIMTSTLGDHRSINKAYRHECDAYMVKPIVGKLLLEHISNLSPGPKTYLN